MYTTLPPCLTTDPRCVFVGGGPWRLGLNEKRVEGASCLQKLWRIRVQRIANSKVVFKRLGELGQRRGRKLGKTAGLCQSGYSFEGVRTRVVGSAVYSRNQTSSVCQTKWPCVTLRYLISRYSKVPASLW